MAVEPGSRNPTRFGISRQSLDEIQGIAILFVGSVCFLALFSANKPSNLIGPSGAFLAKWLTFVVGRIVAYFVPSVLLLWGVSRFRGIGWTHPLFRIVGLLLVVVAGCGLLYQMGYDLGRFSSSQNERDYVSFQWSGVLGAFLVSSGGLNIPRYIGTTGAYLAFGSLSAIGILLATNFLFYSFFVSLWQRLRHGREAISARVQRLVERGQKEKALPGAGRFRRSHSARVFGGGADDSTAAATDMPEAEQHELPSLVVESPIGHAVEVDDERDEEEEQNQSEVALSRPDQMALFAGYQIPSLDLLSAAPPSNESLSEKDIEVLSRTIEEKLASFDIEVEVTNVTQGPVVTLFELQTAEGVKIGRIVTLENDLAMALRASRLRILAPIPGRGTVGIEIPNRKPTVVRLREILESREFQSQDAALLFGVGKTIDGKPYICNLAKMPHLLIAGTTGSGKSVCLNAIICSFLLRNSPDRLRLIMIDPKRVELSVYQGIPHLLAPVVNDPRKSAAALAWVLTQMEERYRQLAEMGLRNIDAYNALA
ncbi:DNA translocase FtsK 4TM domain-containing protein, partial [Candidatus Sumerlaeota bacterium]|nr:DNA translocase FtsK 4TM domain-containing protein [Candidatus Sumerlaeota bacterium]